MSSQIPSKKPNLSLATRYARLVEESSKLTGYRRGTPLKEFVKMVRLFTNTHTCILTFIELDKEEVLRIASSSKNQEFEDYLDKKQKIHLNHDEGESVNFNIASEGKEYETHALQNDGGGVSSPAISKKYNLRYFYCFPIKIDEKLKGYLNFFSTGQKPLSKDLKIQIKTFAKFAEIPIRQYEIEKAHNHSLREAIEEMAVISGANQRDQILKIVLKYAIKLLGKDKIFSSVLKLDENSGVLIESKAYPDKETLSEIPFGEGFCSRALINEKELIIDIISSDWKKTYVDIWKAGTKSEMAIPLLIKNARVRIKNNVDSASRPIAVLNFESCNLNEFTQEDVDILSPLVSQASLLFEKLVVERKLTQLREIEKLVLTKRNTEEILEIIAQGIRDVLGFEVVNISLVNESRRTIESKIIVGIEPQKTEKFLQMASHSLSSKDIHASIIKFRNIEVPDKKDERFDESIWEEFEQQDLIRVFVPVISSLSNKGVGTIEAGYRKGFRKYIYESDVRILQVFAELISEELEKQNSLVMDKISHELRSPVSGILGNVDRLKAHHRQWEDRFIDVRLEDIELDCEILRHNILELEYFLGKAFPKAKIGDTPIFVMRDIVLKALKQLKPVIEDEGYYFDVESCIEKNDLSKIKIYTDKIKLGQVFYNLLVNSIRYADKNSKRFRLKISVDDITNKDYFIIKFQDWGIGIKEEYKNRIFEDYFRSPEAKANFVSGTGLGLTISRNIMKNDIKGDLVLTRCFNPTEFEIRIPKRYEKKPL